MPSARGVEENVIATFIALAIVAVATWAISHVDAPIALWSVVPIGVAALVAGIWLGRSMIFGDELLGYQADLIAEAILGLRDVIAGGTGISFENFIERGVLGPAGFGLSAVRGEEIRLSVLEFDEGGQMFRMPYEFGHSLGYKNGFSLSKASLAGHALESEDLQWTNNVEGDKRWQPGPKVGGSREYGSVASMPIIVGGGAVAVLNVVSNRKNAFSAGDLTYIELLGGFLGLAWALDRNAGPSPKLGSSQEPVAPDGKDT